MLFLLACATAETDDTSTKLGTEETERTENGAPLLEDGGYDVDELLQAEETCGLEEDAGSAWAMALFTFGVDIARTSDGYSVTWSSFSADGTFTGDVGVFSGEGQAEVDGCTFQYALSLTITITSNTSFDAAVSLRFVSSTGNCGDTETPCDIDVAASFVHE